MTDISLNSSFLNRLRAVLKKPLPGESSHLKMASSNRMIEMKKRKGGNDPIQSSVLILLYPRKKKVYTSFILRQNYNGVHSGQVSFPGGRKEPGDSSDIATALREAHEEVNVDPGSVRILGKLSELYIPPSNFIVTPVVGFTENPPDFVPEVAEVSSIIESDLDFLFDPKALKSTIFSGKNYSIEAPYFDVKGHIVWGATAMILSELKDVIQRVN